MADPDCPECRGMGLVLDAGDKGPPSSSVCTCVLRDQLVSNLERGMRGLANADRLAHKERSPLSVFVKRDMWVTASPDWFRAHLRHTAARVPNAYRWGFKVVTDSDLVVAWLATAALQGVKIYDGDFHSEAAPVSLTKMTLVDIADPPELLIIRLGVKAARNSATPEVLLEALTHRAHAGKPTWVWDQPENRFSEGHLAYSHVVAEFLSTWERLRDADQLSTMPVPSARTSRGRSGPPAQPVSNVRPGASIRDIMLGSTK